MSIALFARTLRLFACLGALTTSIGIAVIAQDPAPNENASAAGEPREFEFSRGIENWAIGADGTRLALRDHKTSEIVVIDVSRGESLCRSAPFFVDQKCEMAADADAVYLLSKKSQQLIALRLDDGSEIARTEIDYPKLDAVEIVAGAAARGPIALYVSPENPKPTDDDYHGVQLLDRQTLRPYRDEEPLWQTEKFAHTLGSASNDGSTFLFSTSNSRLLCWRNGEGWLLSRVHADGAPLLSESGRVLMTDRVHAGNHLPRDKTRADFPASLPEIEAYPEGERATLLRTFGFDLPMHAQIGKSRGGNSLRLAFAESPESLEPVGVLDFLCELEQRPEGTAGKDWSDRIFYSHHAKAVVAIPLSNRRAVWFRYDMRDAIVEASPPTIKILSSALPPARVGEKWEFKIEALASSGSPTFRLENAPAGMTIDDDGKIDWTPLTTLDPSAAVVNVVASAEGGLQCERRYPLVVEYGEGLLPVPSDLTEAPIVTPDARISFASPKGEVVVLTTDRRAVALGRDGHTFAKTTRLPATYDLIGKRGSYYVAVSGQSRRIDVVHATSGEVIRSAKLPGTRAVELAMHPTKPVSYLSIFENPRTETASFLIFDEEKGTVKESPGKWRGERIAFSPDGTRLAASCLELPESAKRPRAFGQSFPPPPPGAPFGTFGDPPKSRPVTYLYDTFDPLDPLEREKREIDVPSDSPKSPAISWQPDGSLIALSQVNAIVFHDARTLTPTERRLSPPFDKSDFERPTLVAWHPQFRIAAGFILGGFVIDATDPKLDDDFPERMVGSLPEELKVGHVERLWFSQDGRNLVFLHRNGSSARLLVSPLWFPEEFAEYLPDLEEVDGEKPRSFVPLEDLDALRGGGGKVMTARAIAERFASSIAVVESGDSRGTAFVVGSAGYALTCDHVVERGKPVRLVFLDPKNPTEDAITVSAEILDQDEEKDMALLKFDPPHALTPLRLSRDERCSLGEPVVVIGNPGLGESVLERTVTTGVVSSTGRRIGTYPLIQLSAQVNPGSSGGPAFDELGRVIGMVTLKARIEGAGFAAPAPELTRFLLRNAAFDDESMQLGREWGEKGSERTVTAKLLSFDDETVRIETASGKTYVLPRARLNEGDALFLSELAKIRKDRDAEKMP